MSLCLCKGMLVKMERKKKPHSIKEVIPGNRLRGKEIIKSLNDRQMNNVMR